MLATVESVKNHVVQMGSHLPEDLIRDIAREMYTTISRYHAWDYLSTEGQVTAVADYTTGTCAITQGLTTVTFAAATLTPAMVTRHFQASGTAGRWYGFRSVNVGAGTAELLEPYEGTTLTAGTFTIRQKYYRLPPDFDKGEVAKEMSGYKVIWWQSRAEFERSMSQISASGQVWNMIPAPATRFTLYSTGVAAMTQGSPTVTITTGVVNKERDNRRRFRAPQFPHLGDFEIIGVDEGANTYTLDRNWMDQTVTAQVYQVDPIGERQIEFYPAPAGGNTSVRFWYTRVPPPLFGETDYPMWLAEMNDLWKQATLLRCFAPKPSDFEGEFNILMSDFMQHQGLQKNRVVPTGKWGIGNSPSGSNLPWNWAPTRFLR